MVIRGVYVITTIHVRYGYYMGMYTRNTIYDIYNRDTPTHMVWAYLPPLYYDDKRCIDLATPRTFDLLA